MVCNNGNCSPNLLVTTAWYVIYKIQRSTLRLCTLAEIQRVIFNLRVHTCTNKVYFYYLMSIIRLFLVLQHINRQRQCS